MTTNESTAKLMQVLKEVKVTEEEPPFGKEFLALLKTSGINCPHDFVGFVATRSYEEEWKEICTFEVTTGEGDQRSVQKVFARLLWARVKRAWEILTEIKAKKASTLTNINSDKLDEPLPDETVDSLASTWKRMHNLPLDPHMAPADALVARLYREMSRNAASLVDISKVKAIIQATTPEHRSETALGNGTSIVQENEPNKRRITTVIGYYFGLRILAYAYAYAGSDQVKSMKKEGTMVINAPLPTNIDYADRVLRTTFNLSLNDGDGLRWMQARDVETRSTMVGLMRQGWPQGEALIEAQKEHTIEWASGPKKKSDDEIAAELLNLPSRNNYWPAKKRSSPSVQERTDAKRHKPRFCPMFNKTGCQPTCALTHACNFPMSSGRLCGRPHPSFEHSASEGGVSGGKGGKHRNGGKGGKNHNGGKGSKRR